MIDFLITYAFFVGVLGIILFVVDTVIISKLAEGFGDDAWILKFGLFMLIWTGPFFYLICMAIFFYKYSKKRR